MNRSMFVLVALIIMSLAVAGLSPLASPYVDSLRVANCMYGNAFSMATDASSYSAPNAMSIYSQLGTSYSALFGYAQNSAWSQFGAEYATFLSLVNQLQQLYFSYGMSPSGPGVNSLMSNYYGYQNNLQSCLNGVKT